MKHFFSTESLLRSRLIALLGSVCLVPSCGLFYEQNKFTSAVLEPSRKPLLAQAIGKNRVFRVCAEADTAVKRTALAKETRLAMYAWLSIADRQFPFRVATSRFCSTSPRRNDMIVALPSRSRSREPDFPQRLFNRAAISCQKTPQVTCAYNNLNGTIIQPSTRDRTVRILFSPFVIWLSLPEDMHSAEGQHLAALYQQLSNNESYKQLVTGLAAKRAMSFGDQNFHTYRRSFIDSNLRSMDETIYTAQLGIYAHLLRDVGFVFGLTPQRQPGERVKPIALYPTAADIAFAKQTEGFHLLTQHSVTH